MRSLFSLVDWASKLENKKAWQQLMQASGGQLTDDPFKDPQANFEFGDAAFIGMGSLCMNKARRLGWTGFVDTIEVLFEMYCESFRSVYLRCWNLFLLSCPIHPFDANDTSAEMGKLGMVPAMKVDKPKPLV